MKKLAACSVLAVTLLSGCKLFVVVPAGGQVVTQSGAYICLSGQTCKISVIDLFFDETFIAVADKDYTFSHWANASQHLCLGVGGPCELTTKNFEGFPILMEVLASDAEVFIQPVFHQNGEFSDDPASVCFNPSLYQQENEYVVTMRDTITFYYETLNASETVVVGSNSTGVVVKGSQKFDGKNASALTSEGALTGFNQKIVTESSSFFVPNLKDRQIVHLGNRLEGEFTPGIDSDFRRTKTETIFEPGMVMRFNLEAGASYSESYTNIFHSEVWDAGHTEEDTVSTYKGEKFYRGVETITVPAGVFRACRFDSVGATTSQDTGTVPSRPDTVWYGVENGLLLKTETKDGMGSSAVSELESASINGQPVVGVVE